MDAEGMDFMSYDEAVALVDDMWTNLGGHESGVHGSQIMEQVRAVTRDHLAGIGCDANDDMQTRAALCGALLAITIQAQASPIAIGSVLMARSLAEIAESPQVSEVDWNEVVRALSREDKPGDKSRRRKGFLRRVRDAL